MNIEDEYVFYCDGKETARTKGSISQVLQFMLLSTEVKGYRQGDGTRRNESGETSLGDAFIVD